MKHDQHATRPTSEVRSLRQRSGNFAIALENGDQALLYEIHLVTDRCLADNDISGLEHFVLQFGDDVVYEVRVGVREERNRGNQPATVVVDNLLQRQFRTFDITQGRLHHINDGANAPWKK